jgi:hypothetical protein
MSQTRPLRLFRYEQRCNRFTLIKVTRLRHISKDRSLSHEAQGSANSLSFTWPSLAIGFMFAPREIGIDAVPADASPRTNRLSPDFRRSHSWDCSVELDGSACGAVAHARVARLFLVIHLLMTVAFLVAGPPACEPNDVRPGSFVKRLAGPPSSNQR